MINFSLENLFQILPSPSFPYAKYAWGVSFVFLLLSIFLPVIRRRVSDPALRKALKNKNWWCWYLAFFYSLLIFARFAQIPLVSMRIWWIVGFVFTLFLGYLVYKEYKTHQTKNEFFQEKNTKISHIKKYLPKKKKK
jgi:amino acid transporter